MQGLPVEASVQKRSFADALKGEKAKEKTPRLLKSQAKAQKPAPGVPKQNVATTSKVPSDLKSIVEIIER